MNRNRRNQRRARFGQAYQLRATSDFWDTFSRNVNAICEALDQASLAFALARSARLSADVQRGTQDHHTEDQ